MPTRLLVGCLLVVRAQEPVHGNALRFLFYISHAVTKYEDKK